MVGTDSSRPYSHEPCREHASVTFPINMITQRHAKRVHTPQDYRGGKGRDESVPTKDRNLPLTL